jgi:cytochrome c oxidase subunit I+III
VVLLDVLLHLRSAERKANVWEAGTLEWLPIHSFGPRSIPRVRSAEPLWDQPRLAREVEEGRHYLPQTATGLRETIVSSAVDARPQYVQVLPGWSFLPLVAGVGTAAFFLLLTVKLVVPAFVGGAIALAAMLKWMWETDRGATIPPVDIGGGLRLPVYAAGPVSHSWWAMVVLMLVDGTVFASLIFSWFFLAHGADAAWPPAGVLPSWQWPVAAALAYAAGVALLTGARRALRRSAHGWFRLALTAALAAVLAAHGLDVWGLVTAGLRPSGHAYGAMTYAVAAWQGVHMAALFVMVAYTLARSWGGLLDAQRRVTFDNTRLFLLYVVAQGLAGLALVHH